ncbi:helix-turn-helix transcriptional regulator [Enterococcus faecium]|uniref:helix-turn-helix domain-containing protein n=1 Tax=Enterococcus faecium TaxID=1352 RepID=UPI0019EB660C|nr:helix-turn-helix transcriptional regulator [Enterococcus faecium]MCU1871711.1 helix-turn-helix domain-containing protein [Enterococcus faecium]MDT2290801.1 helix-turn-helix transcriptional regulator [Enterococcus faecium]
MFPERLIELRKQQNLTQQELANLLNVSKQTVGSWERGRTEPSIPMINELANILNTSTDYLTGRINDSSSNLKPKTGDNIISHFRLNTANMETEDIEELEEELNEYMEFLIQKAKARKKKK